MCVCVFICFAAFFYRIFFPKFESGTIAFEKEEKKNVLFSIPTIRKWHSVLRLEAWVVFFFFSSSVRQLHA